MRAELLLRRNYLLFHFTIGFFVLICSFAYGFVHALSSRTQLAQALFNQQTAAYSGGAFEPASGAALAEGIFVLPVGKNTNLSGHRANVLSFVSKREVKSLLSEQVNKWQSRGLFALGVGSARRGIALAVDKMTGRRQIMSISLLPEALRRTVSQDMLVQGMLAVVEGQALESLSESEKKGLVPDVPLYPGGKSGGVFSTEEGIFRSYSGMYYNPAGIKENMEFYRQALRQKDWQESAGEFFPRIKDAGIKDTQIKDIAANLSFVRDEAELTLLFSAFQAKGGSSSKEKTLVLVNISPRQKIAH